MTARIGTWLGALALLAGAMGVTPAAQASGAYVALGDSFASGVGTRTYYDDSGGCYRSPKAYPVLDAARLGATLRFKACSGASVPDVRTGQLGPLSATTTRVSVQVGGNDAGFSDVITTCAQPSWAADCGAAVDKAQAFIADKLGARLDNLYADIGRPGSERPGGGRRLPTTLQRPGLQRRHLVQPHGDDPAQPDGRPAQRQDPQPGGLGGLRIRGPERRVPRARGVCGRGVGERPVDTRRASRTTPT